MKGNDHPLLPNAITAIVELVEYSDVVVVNEWRVVQDHTASLTC